MKIFIADDSSEFRERIVALLSDVYKIDMIGEAGNVQDAINKIQDFNPDVVILDIQMPGGSGIDVLRKINKKNCAPVIIILTNYPYPQYRQQYLESGADFFFDKSYEFEKVLDVLSDISARGIQGKSLNTCVDTQFKETG